METATILDAEAIREIAMLQHPEALWDAADCAAYLRCQPRQVTERYATLEDFPKAIRLPSRTGKGHPKWRAEEVRDWVRKYQRRAK